ncbi:redoxin domain-containing protein [Paenarthrobacter sp. Z7-10]|uniref:peroxiredoxin family protein n=1 Tax=Paenarthrobacter sp. Z7-10 TaxID=2787635 RepID=UPI0022A99E4E|nr:peroxiredoxin family protein [Paenarthrobacter sp. Z7-10]MCZ2404445.1 redoxin domain-containing protein [Paenarthrobacter sp. Z7-10]
MAATKTGRPSAGQQRRTRRSGLLWAALAAVVAAVIAAVVLVNLNTHSAAPTGAGKTAAGYAVGNPGPGAQAPAFSIPSTTGGTVNLSDYRGKTVLLYFHEGLGCQPCWDQIRDLDAAKTQLHSAGIDQVLTITSGPVNLIAQKMTDDKLTATALADTKLDVSRTYGANQFGMMGDSRDGHSFILVGPDGRIQWRADYGGAPDYTMYVPVAKILTDLQAGRTGK